MKVARIDDLAVAQLNKESLTRERLFLFSDLVACFSFSHLKEISTTIFCARRDTTWLVQPTTRKSSPAFGSHNKQSLTSK